MNKCQHEYKLSKALVNTPSFGMPDFVGDDINSRGQTMSMIGSPVLVDCQKCVKCGHSIRQPIKLKTLNFTF